MSKWKWICGPVDPKAKCKGCDKRLFGEHLVQWTDDTTWHLACLLDDLAVRPPVMMMSWPAASP